MTDTDLSIPWLKFARRMRDTAKTFCHNHNGYTILSVKILIDADGQPCFWTRAGYTPIESGSIHDDLLEHLSSK